MDATTIPEDASDEVLAECAALGNHQAFDTLALRYQAQIYRLACRLVGVDDALDVVQEAFLSAFKHVGTFRRESTFSTWLYRIATNAALMHRRSRARRRADSLDAFLPTFNVDGSHRGTPAALQVAARADELLDRRLVAEKVRAVLDQLPDSSRDAFVLRDLEELSTAEVARILDLEPAAVRQRVHRARVILRGLLSAMTGGAS